MSQQSGGTKGEVSADLIGRLFLPADDLSVTVLRGHLAVEQRLITGLEQRFPYPQALNLQRQPFSQLVMMAQAFTYREDNAWVWKAINAITEARNYLAHDLDAPDLTAKVERFLTCVENYHPTTRSTSDGDLLTRLRHAIAWVCGILESRHLWRETRAAGP